MATSDEVLDFIEVFIEEHKYPPSLREIMNGVGLRSTSTVAYHLSELEERGEIKRQHGKSRAIEVLEPSQPS